MPTFSSNGVNIAYVDAPADSGSDTSPTSTPTSTGPTSTGQTVLLIHGFASNSQINWVDTGWVKHLTRAGYRVLTIDNRGHGASEKLYNLADYGAPLMAEDARQLLDHLGIMTAHVMGYSMGARITAFLTMAHPERVRSAVFAGLGINMIKGFSNTDPIAEALEAADPASITNPMGRTFRLFADQTKSDRLALAACMRSARQPITAAQISTISRPTMVAVGTTDDVAGSGSELAALIPGARVLDIPGRDHMRAVGDRVYKDGVLQFYATI
jgi:pimeloyl-ACP methyl ester carboxylesterase